MQLLAIKATMTTRDAAILCCDFGGAAAMLLSKYSDMEKNECCWREGIWSFLFFEIFSLGFSPAYHWSLCIACTLVVLH